MKYLLTIFIVLFVYFIPKNEAPNDGVLIMRRIPNKTANCGDHLYQLSYEFILSRYDTIFRRDGSMYVNINQKYLKPFHCSFCKTDTLIKSPDPYVYQIKEPDINKFLSYQF